MTQWRGHLFQCPQCRKPLVSPARCVCGFAVRERDGILDFLTDIEVAAIEPFLAFYDRVRTSEQWGGDDLDLPFHPKRHRDIWRIRQRTFRTFEALTSALPRGIAVDAGAGNCWMTRYLHRWGFEAIAADINDSDMDGLRAGGKFIDAGADFLRIRAGMERLPFVSDSITLLAANASFHYAGDFRAALAEFERVLTPGGTIAIIDTPFYENTADGERMIAHRVAEFSELYAMPAHLARRSRYLTYGELRDLSSALKLQLTIHPVWPGIGRTYRELRARLAGSRIAKFPLALLRKRS
jgi:SAM-dependent methyltransferase